MKEHEAVHSPNGGSRKDIYYSLKILIELADNYYFGGCSSMYISRKNDIPLPILTHLIERMKEAGLIGAREDNSDRLFLKREPHSTWILEAVAVLKVVFGESKTTK